MKILVTGGAGFIGSHIVERYHYRAEVRVLDLIGREFAGNLAGFRCGVLQGTILDRELIHRAMLGVDYVFHTAAMVSVADSMRNPFECHVTNTVGTLMLLEEAERAGVKKFIFSSSASVYGDCPEEVKHEDVMPRPRSPYAISKLDGEHYCNMFTADKRLQTVCLRYFNVFGHRQVVNSRYAAIPMFVQKALRNEPIVIHGDGEQTRDFIYVHDVASINEMFASNDITGVFNVGSGVSITINELVSTIRKLTKSKSEVLRAEPRIGDVRASLAGVQKLREAGVISLTPFHEALKTTVSLTAAQLRSKEHA